MGCLTTFGMTYPHVTPRAMLEGSLHEVPRYVRHDKG